MCTFCGPLVKAIDRFIEKADGNLAETLGEEGYIEPEKTVEYESELEDNLADALTAETEYIIGEAEKAVDLETFAKDIWPGVKYKDALKAGLVTVFRDSFERFMPEFVEYYIKAVDHELKLPRLSKKAVAWTQSWSEELADIMQLNSHAEIEAILVKGLENGDGIETFVRNILESGIRDEHYKARRTALTEVLTAHRAAQQEAGMQSPAVDEKGWRHSGAWRITPRKNHMDMDGKRVPKGKPFILVGADGVTYYPMYPGDPVLPPGERINCHCLEQLIVNKDILGLPLEERQRLQQEAIDSMDDEWEKELDAANRAKAGIEVQD